MYNLMKAAALVGLGATSSLAQSDSPDGGDTRCYGGLYMIVARGTDEPEGPGVTGQVAERLASLIEDSAVHALDYPATYVDPYYFESVKAGSDKAREAITDYAERCPDGKIALFGYSQGAFVVGNSLCGIQEFWGDDTVLSDIPALEEIFDSQRDSLFYEAEKGVDKDLISDKLISVILFGDSGYNAETSFAVGDATSIGLWPRDWDLCETYAPFIQNYCDKGDILCDVENPYIEGVHQHYVQAHGSDAIEFTLKKWNENTGDNLDIDAGPPLKGSGINPNDDSSDGHAGHNATTTSTSTPTNTGSPSSTDTEEEESEPTAGAASLTSSLMTGGPIMLLAAWALL